VREAPIVERSEQEPIEAQRRAATNKDGALRRSRSRFLTIPQSVGATRFNAGTTPRRRPPTW
jgi:hypothetical protein